MIQQNFESIIRVLSDHMVGGDYISKTVEHEGAAYHGLEVAVTEMAGNG